MFQILHLTRCVIECRVHWTIRIITTNIHIKLHATNMLHMYKTSVHPHSLPFFAEAKRSVFSSLETMSSFVVFSGSLAIVVRFRHTGLGYQWKWHYILHQNDIHLGRHCCLWCNTDQQQMARPRETRGQQEPRTLDTLQHDLQRFQSAGGLMKEAKHYNNVIGLVLFHVPLDQV